MKFRVLSAHFLDEHKMWEFYGEKLQSVVATRTYIDFNGNFTVEIEVNTIEQLKSVANVVGNDLVFPKNNNEPIWIYDNYIE